MLFDGTPFSCNDANLNLYRVTWQKDESWGVCSNAREWREGKSDIMFVVSGYLNIVEYKFRINYTISVCLVFE